MSFDFVTASYERHQDSYDDYAKDQTMGGHANTWLKNDNVNAYRCQRLHQLSNPFIELWPQATWATVGDGRYGSDAIYLQSQGVDVTATDISDTLLKESQQLGLIDKYSKENAEQLSFANEQFDFVYCKEAYHHFPRPNIALYEMLRVAKKGVILLEPIDRQITPTHQRLCLGVKDLIKRLVRKPVVTHFYEPDGNYLYAISKRELEKVALGVGLKYMVFKGINDIYLEGIEYAPMEKQNPVYKKMMRKLAIYNTFSKLNLIPYNLLFAAIMKELSHKEIEVLLSQGYEVVRLPDNPYLNERSIA